MEWIKDLFDFPFQFLVFERRDNRATPILRIICPSYITGLFQAVTSLAVAAFVVSRKQNSFLVAGLLAASGGIIMILPLTRMNFAFPGPIVGVAVGAGILGLGIARGIRKTRKAVAAAS